MQRAEVIKRLDNILSQAERERAWGVVEVEFRNGEATLLRKTITDRLDGDRERTHDYNQTYRR